MHLRAVTPLSISPARPSITSADVQMRSQKGVRLIPVPRDARASDANARWCARSPLQQRSRRYRWPRQRPAGRGARGGYVEDAAAASVAFARPDVVLERKKYGLVLSLCAHLEPVHACWVRGSIGANWIPSAKIGIKPVFTTCT